MAKVFSFIHKFITDDVYRFCWLDGHGLCDHLTDESYVKKSFKVNMGYELDINNPKTFNEKLQWLKIHDRKDIYTVMADKYKVRDYVSDTIGDEYLIPLIGVWDSPSDIDFDSLPDKFVLKCNHNSGRGMCICTDKSSLDIQSTKSQLKQGLEENYYLRGREWPYKNIERKIICEKYMTNSHDTNELSDYKIMCFNGEPTVIYTCTNRFSKQGVNVTFFDTKWNQLPFSRCYCDVDDTVQKPNSLDEMLMLAKKLSKDIPFCRVDFYEIEGRPYFGEITFFPASGFEPFKPNEWDFKLGELIDIN